MIDRRRAVRLALAALPAIAALRSVAARADQAFRRFLPLFIDIDGWKGGKPDGMTMEMSDNSIEAAPRDPTPPAISLIRTWSFSIKTLNHLANSPISSALPTCRRMVRSPSP